MKYFSRKNVSRKQTPNNICVWKVEFYTFVEQLDYLYTFFWGVDFGSYMEMFRNYSWVYNQQSFWCQGQAGVGCMKGNVLLATLLL